MKLSSHLRAHWRTPFYAFCEWYVFGRESNWAEVPTPIDVAGFRTYRCEHLTLSGPLRSVNCRVCGPLNVESMANAHG